MLCHPSGVSSSAAKYESLTPIQVSHIMGRVQVGDRNDCWPWLGGCNKAGYGQSSLHISGKVRTFLVHRVAYLWGVGPLVDGLTIDHLCRNRRCSNPWHLEQVDFKTNRQRGRFLTGPENHTGARTMCPQGHSYTEENTYRNSGRRYCRMCMKQRMRAWYVKSKLSA